MSKRAEQYARTLYTPWSEDGMSRKDNTEVIEACIKGYEQAEKDLALTAEDMAKIDAIILDVNNEFAVDYSKEISRQKFYEEVLNRYNELKK